MNLMRVIILVLWHTLGSKAAQKLVCEQKLDTISCPLGELITIVSVQYGRTQANICNPSGLSISNLNCRSTQISTNAILSSCQGRTICLLSADNRILGEDPCPTIPKYLEVVYDCVTQLSAGITTSPLAPSASTITQSTPTKTIPTTTSSISTPTSTSSTPTSTISTTTSTRSTPTSTASTQASTASTPITTTSSLFNLVPPGINGLKVCHEYLVSGSRGVADSQLSASSIFGPGHEARRGRLYVHAQQYPNGFKLMGGWSALSTDSNPWIQVRFNWLSIVQGVVTQGRHVDTQTGCCDQWVTQYKVEYSLDGITWQTVQNQSTDVIFNANKDQDSPVTHMLPCPLVARFLRIKVDKFYQNPSIRFDVIGCPATTVDIGSCTSGWIERPGSDECYFITNNSNMKSWEEAEATCKRQQGEMVKIDSVQEKNWLSAQLQALNKPSSNLNAWWTSLNNIPRTDNQDYRWTDGTPLDANVLQWRPNEPSNAGGNEHCGTLIVDQLNDLDCDVKLPFICESTKFWKSPVNIPQLMTLLPTTPSTLAPTTARYNVPIPSGLGPAVAMGQNVFSTGCYNVTNCSNMKWGDYQSCNGCGFYMTCAPNGAFLRPCPSNLKYDDNLVACTTQSSTCQGP